MRSQHLNECWNSKPKQKPQNYLQLDYKRGRRHKTLHKIKSTIKIEKGKQFEE